MTRAPEAARDASSLDRDPGRASGAHRPRRRGRLVRRLALLGGGLAALAAVVLLVLAIRYVPYVDDARGLLASAERISAEIRGLQPGDVERELIDRLGADLGAMRARLERVEALVAGDPLIELARRVPAVRQPLDDAEPLLAGAGALLDAGDIALELGDRFVAIRERQAADPGGSLLAGVVELMSAGAARVDDIDRLLSAAEASLEQVPGDAHPSIRRAAEMMSLPIATYGPLLDEYRAIDDVLPAILGRDGKRRYLVLAQNPAELRPTGGYTGTYGLISFEQGRLTERSFADVYSLDLRPGVPYVEPPEGLQNHLLGPASWQLADANWSPDFPTSAQDALRLYTLESGDDRVDGVIGLNTYAIDEILDAIGPVDVPEYGVTVRAGEVTMTALGLTRGISTPTSRRKEFLNALANRVVARLFALPPERWMPLLGAWERISERRSMLAWFKDPAAQALIAGTPVAGSVRQDRGDYLFVVEANVAPTSKYNLVVDRRTTLDVAIAGDGAAASTVRLEWQNHAAKPGEPYSSIRTYSTSTEGRYGAYVRVLTPAGSELASATGESDGPISGVERVAPESGRNSFANYLLIPPGAAELTYRYRTARVAERSGSGWQYRLTVQKQPGMRAEEIEVRVTLPPGASVTSVSGGATRSGAVVTMRLTLTTDAELAIAYELP